MISLARLTVERAEAGHPPTLEELDAIPRFQWRVWFNDLAAICPSRLESGWRAPERRTNRNRLRIEEHEPEDRCAVQSPDGRGYAWLSSGGSHLAYGRCARESCPHLVSVSPVPEEQPRLT